jgi:hypothetical protein
MAKLAVELFTQGNTGGEGEKKVLKHTNRK